MALIKFTDCSKQYEAIVEESNPRLIGYEYKFNSPFFGIITKDSYDCADLHYGCANPKPFIPKGTKVEFDAYWFNFYGSYFVINYQDKKYDIHTNCVEIIRNITNKRSYGTGKQTNYSKSIF